MQSIQIGNKQIPIAVFLNYFGPLGGANITGWTTILHCILNYWATGFAWNPQPCCQINVSPCNANLLTANTVYLNGLKLKSCSNVWSTPTWNTADLVLCLSIIGNIIIVCLICCYFQHPRSLAAARVCAPSTWNKMCCINTSFAYLQSEFLLSWWTVINTLAASLTTNRASNFLVQSWVKPTGSYTLLLLQIVCF